MYQLPQTQGSQSTQSRYPRFSLNESQVCNHAILEDSKESSLLPELNNSLPPTPTLEQLQISPALLLLLLLL